jgi:hypothetical protein
MDVIVLAFYEPLLILIFFSLAVVVIAQRQSIAPGAT